MRRFIPWVPLAALAGAIFFVVVQKATGFPAHIAEFMGGQIVRQGGYDPSLAGVIGWGVHLAVALSYTVLFTLLVNIPIIPAAGSARRGVGLVLVVLMGWVSTLLTAPAIAVTISLLAGQGWPATLPGLNTAFGVPFWNHVGFFTIVWLLVEVVPALRAAAAPTS